MNLHLFLAYCLAVAILLLAGPQRLREPQSQRVLTNIEFCVDISGSIRLRGVVGA